MIHLRQIVQQRLVNAVLFALYTMVLISGSLKLIKHTCDFVWDFVKLCIGQITDFYY